MIFAERFKNLLDLTRRPVEHLDSSYMAAFYLLAADQDLYELAQPHISIDGIDFARMRRKAGGLEERQQQVLSVAHNLFSWTSRCTVSPHDLSRLGYPLLDYVNTAMYISGGHVKVQVLENDAGEATLLKLDMGKYEQTKQIYHIMFDNEPVFEPAGLEQ